MTIDVDALQRLEADEAATAEALCGGFSLMTCPVLTTQTTAVAPQS
ncbi:ALQxL family class IV lanthipeptide [Kitasatospora sp. NPDC058965]